MKLSLHLKYILLPAALMLLPVVGVAAEPDPTPDETEEGEVVSETTEPDGEDESEAERIGLVEIPGEADDIDIPIPAFIHRGANRIVYNGADWTPLRNAFRQSGSQTVSIVHIGDSHVQADINTGTVRSLLQYDFGNAGRGIVAPLKMSGTNQPRDYVMQSRSTWNAAKLMSPTWGQTMGFTGTSIHPVSSSSEITVGTVDAEDYNPFTSFTLFHGGRLNVTSVTDEAGTKLDYRAVPSRDYTQILLSEPHTQVNVAFNSAGDLTLYGISLSGDRPGVFYHAIGNNGACFDTYNRIGTLGLGLNPLSPDLVIISLGTNEAFGKLNTAAFTRSIDRLVRSIRTANPQALILLTTPMECQRRVTTTKKVRVPNKKRKGRKRTYRTVNRSTRTFAVNHNIAPLRQAILDYGRDKGIAVWDWYDVAGGQGASTDWIRADLFAKDRVHHSHKGYALEGRLLYDAIMESLRASN